jgi:hypothetical protein
MTQPITFRTFFHYSNNIWWQVQFMKVYVTYFSPISYYFQPKKSTNWSALLPNPVTVFPQCHRPSVTPTTIKILHKHTHVYTSTASFVKAGRIAKHYKAAVCISTHSFTLNFFTLQSLLLNPTPIHFQFPPHKTPNNAPARSRFVLCNVPTVNLE